MLQPLKNQYDAKRKQDLVSNLLGRKLGDEDFKEAMRICREDFSDEHEFTASEFCQRLAATRPEVSLGTQTRLVFLRGVREQGMQSQSNDEPWSFNPFMPTAQSQSSEALRPPVLERRQHLRKITDLMGVFWHTIDRAQTGAMTIENLSVGGCGIHILTPHMLKRGDMLRLEFKLDDEHETFIRLRGKISWILYDMAGIEFWGMNAMPEAFMHYLQS